MGLFGRKKREPGPGAAPSLVVLARRVLAERGVETTVEGPADDPSAARLRGSDGQVYLFGNLAGMLEGADTATQEAAVRRHLDAMLASRSDPAAEDMSPDELRQRIRLRLLAERGPDGIDLSYARPFVPGVVAALCVDFPTTVATLSAETVHRLPLGIDELFAIGQLNSDDEPVDQQSEVAPGFVVVEGESLFTASKAVNLPAVLGALPYGAVIAIPHRHLLLAVPIRDADSLTAVNTLAGALVQVVSDPRGAPGGVLSDRLLFARDGEVSIVSSFDPESGAMRIEVDERFQEALEQAMA